MQILPFNYQNRMNNIQYNNKRTTNSPTFKATLPTDYISRTLETLKNNHSPNAEAIAREVLKEVGSQIGCGTSVVISDKLAIKMATALLSVDTDALSAQKQNPNIGGTGDIVLKEPSGYSRHLNKSDIDHVERLGPNWTRVYRRGSGQKYNDVHASASEVESMLESSRDHIVETDYAGV